MIFDSSPVGRVFSFFTILVFVISICTGISLFLITKKPFTDIYTRLGIKKKLLLKIHCPASILTPVLSIAHAIANIRSCGLTMWIAIGLMFITCYTGYLFPKLSTIWPDIEWKKKKMIMRLIHFGLLIIIIIMVIGHAD